METSILYLHMHHIRDQRQRGVHPLLDPVASLEEYQQRMHPDLARINPPQLERERYSIRRRALLADTPVPWLAERMAALDAEARRGGEPRWR